MDLAGHLYASFLHGHTADVVLRVVGTWSAIYRLHRVVLIQAGFFRSLFTSGFEEATSERKEIEVVFDDTNITRAAFELCIGRLYGGGPPLYIFPELVPTHSKPLTPAFPFGPPITNTAPDKHQPSPPRFLLSLLATSLYLEIPSIASHALSSILATIGPYTIIDYLNFARGKPVCIDSSDSPAVGLEHVAEITNFQSETGDSLDDTASVSSWSVRSHVRTSLRFYYGAISDKIGEACACWLARWGPDMFAYEEAISSIPTSHTSRKRADTIPSDQFNQRDALPVIPLIFTSFRPGEGLPPEWIRALVSSDSFFVPDELARYTFAKRMVELRRRLRQSHGEPTMSIKGKGKETQQYDHGNLPDEGVEEREWGLLFENGIYYTNLTPADLISLSSDISQTTSRTYVPLHALQAANWEHSRLRHIISSSAGGGTEKERSLGIGITGPELYGTQMHAKAGDVDTGSRPYFLVPHDESLRIGDTINTPGSALAEGNIHNNISMDQLFQRSFSLHSRSTSESNNSASKNNEDLPTTSNERTYFGLLPDTLDSLLRHSPPPHNQDSNLQPKIHNAFGPQRTYTTQPPFRFSVEFWDLDTLKEKQRLYSQTVWYAGSLFNIYVQVAKKKENTAVGERSRDRSGRDGAGGNDTQLGIYLHRQSSVESIPARSAPSPIAFPQGLRGMNSDAPEVVNLREGESVLIGTTSLSGRPSSPQGDTGRRDNGGPSSNWLRTHVRGPSLPLSLGGSGSSSAVGTGSVPQSPTLRTGSPLSLNLTRSRTPINISNSRTRPGTSSSLTPSSSSGSTGALSSSLPNDTLNIQSLSLAPPPPLSNLESGSNAVTPSIEQSPPGPLSILTSSGNPSMSSYTSSSPPHVVTSPSPPQQPYRDPRQVVSVYFSVYCASPTGNGQTRFRSGPDVFKIGQSWGWKSGGLLGSIGPARGVAGGNHIVQSAGGVKEDGSWALTGKELSLRATVILGVV
ncbi:hypothetical protein PQX77_022093 [Marasmius sp. AFHP31]|nr:hypothetical protein PQX77_022093 [Marasmius sp. AFHP31]